MPVSLVGANSPTAYTTDIQAMTAGLSGVSLTVLLELARVQHAEEYYGTGNATDQQISDFTGIDVGTVGTRRATLDGLRTI